MTTTEHFDKAARDWDQKSRRVELAEIISKAITTLPLSKDMNGMEYGCGTGLVGMAVAPSLRSLTSIDTSQGMLDVLQEKIQNQDAAVIKTHCCNLLEDKYTQKHDLIFCSMTLHHIQDTEAILKRFAELLNPGGYLAIADLITEDGSFHKPSAQGIWHQGFDPDNLTTLLEGFAMESINNKIIHTIVREENNKEYPVFLLTGRKTA